MYSVVLATLLTAGAAAPDFGGKGLGCHGCYGAAYGGCYGVCYGGWACHGCCGGCYGGCYGCYGGYSCHGCCGGWSCWGGCCGGSWSACYGGCFGGCCGGWSSCYGGCWGAAVYSCYGGCSGCYGGSCCGGWSCYGCFGGCSGVWAGWSASRPAPRMGVYTAPPGPSYSPPPVVGSDPSMPSYAPMMSPAPASVQGGYVVGPSNGDVQPNYVPAPVQGQSIVPSNGGAPQGAILPGPSGNEVSKPATVVIKAASDVKVLFNGQLTTRKKEQESFKTPLLKPGRLYAYDVVAEVTRDGKTYTASKKITVQAGETSEVSFGDAREVIAASEAQTARITVLLPEGGKLFVDGKEHGSGAAKQTFSTPKLAKGKTYYYTLKVEVTAANNAGAKTQRVNVEAGKDVTVDFRSMFVAAE